VVNNKDMYKVNSEINPSMNIRQNSNLYQPSLNLATYKKGIYYFGINVHFPRLRTCSIIPNNLNQD